MAARWSDARREENRNVGSRGPHWIFVGGRRNVPHVSPEARGYWFWVPTAAAIAVTELLAAFGGPDIPWPTISRTVGHLGDQWGIVYFAVVVVIGAVAFHGFAYRDLPDETALGRAKRADSDPQPPRYYTWWIALLAVIIVALAALGADHKETRGYWIYGAFFLFGVFVPSVIVLVFKKGAPFPTFFFTTYGQRYAGPVFSLNASSKKLRAATCSSSGMNRKATSSGLNAIPPGTRHSRSHSNRYCVAPYVPGKSTTA